MLQYSDTNLIAAVQNHNGCIPFYDQGSAAYQWEQSRGNPAGCSYVTEKTAVNQIHPSLLLRYKESKPSELFIAESTTVQDDYLKQLISLFNLEHSYSVANYNISILVNEPSEVGSITVQPPKKRVLASMRVELSSKDFKRRLPMPVILIESEVEE
ncbi:MAG: hypothetical protein QME81_18670 [bacterium]|nr:hypothetical protein [bacterium]